MRSAFFSLLLFALSAPAADDKKPDFKVTAEELTKEYKKDGKAAQAKYQGKTVEVAGSFTVRRTTDVLLQGHKEGIAPNYVSCTPSKEAAVKHQRLYALGRGQKMVFRGVMGDNPFSPVLGECELVSAGPNPAMPVTVAKLRTMFAEPADAKKNDGKPVALRVRVVAVDKSEKSRVAYDVADPANKSKNPPTVKAFVDTFYDKERTEELHAVKARDVLYVLGTADALGSPVRIWDATILKEAPEGVKLPGPKK